MRFLPFLGESNSQLYDDDEKTDSLSLPDDAIDALLDDVDLFDEKECLYYLEIDNVNEIQSSSFSSNHDDSSINGTVKNAPNRKRVYTEEQRLRRNARRRARYVPKPRAIADDIRLKYPYIIAKLITTGDTGSLMGFLYSHSHPKICLYGGVRNKELMDIFKNSYYRCSDKTVSGIVDMSTLLQKESYFGVADMAYNMHRRIATCPDAVLKVVDTKLTTLNSLSIVETTYDICCTEFLNFSENSLDDLYQKELIALLEQVNVVDSPAIRDAISSTVLKIKEKQEKNILSFDILDVPDAVIVDGKSAARDFMSTNSEREAKATNFKSLEEINAKACASFRKDNEEILAKIDLPVRKLGAIQPLTDINRKAIPVYVTSFKAKEWLLIGPDCRLLCQSVQAFNVKRVKYDDISHQYKLNCV